MKYSHAGKPKAVITIPKGKFTFAQLCSANPHVIPLTLRKFIKRDSKLGDNSELILLEEKGETSSDKGMGRKVYMYEARWFTID